MSDLGSETPSATLRLGTVPETGKMTQWVVAFSLKPDHLNLIPRAHFLLVSVLFSDCTEDT